MKDHPLYNILYMFILAAVCSGILIGVSQATRERVEANERLLKVRAVMEAFDLDTYAGAARETIIEDFQRRVEVVPAADAPAADNPADLPIGEILEYRLTPDGDGDPVAYAVPVYGKGYWDDISGVLAVEADRRTVIGLAFFEQKETPGLGAEIENPEWRETFAGVELAEQGKPLEIISGGGRADAPNAVEAVTGATQTSVRVERFMNRRIQRWRAARQKRPDADTDTDPAVDDGASGETP